MNNEIWQKFNVLCNSFVRHEPFFRYIWIVNYPDSLLYAEFLFSWEKNPLAGFLLHEIRHSLRHLKVSLYCAVRHRILYLHPHRKATLSVNSEHLLLMCYPPARRFHLTSILQPIGETSSLCLPVISRLRLLPNFWATCYPFYQVLSAADHSFIREWIALQIYEKY